MKIIKQFEMPHYSGSITFGLSDDAELYIKNDHIIEEDKEFDTYSVDWFLIDAMPIRLSLQQMCRIGKEFGDLLVFI